MMTAVRTCGVLFLLSCSTLSFAQQGDGKRPWKGYSILGNGNLTAVYSDDSRIATLTRASGMQHFYYKDYTADYVTSRSFRLLRKDGQALKPAGTDTVGMKNFFTTQTSAQLSGGTVQTVLCFVHPDDAVVLSLSATGTDAKGAYQFEAQLKKEIKTDRIISMTSFHESGGVAVAVWSNGTALAVAPASLHGRVSIRESSVFVDGSLSGEGSRAEVLLIPAASEAAAIARVKAFQQKKDIGNEAKEYWEAWMTAGRLPVFKSDNAEAALYLEAYKRNIYCLKAATLNGQIPADITGQFVTNNMPQLYPRDAMMCARVLLLTGHFDEARKVIEFWANPKVPMKTPGEWYARYDANAKAVDGGSGARFDEPEWDANGYYIYLLVEYYRAKGVWLADPKLIYQLADFLVDHISPNGLLKEGGIVEWTGYLPATNMICAAALENAAKIARDLGNSAKATTYTAGAKRISAALPEMFDTTRQTYADLRSTSKKGPNGESLADQAGEKTYLWDTTANVGVIWGYQNHSAIHLSNTFYTKNTVKLEGGMQYFDTPDAGLAEYGHDVFFFTTAAAAQYELMYGSKSAGKGFLDWMLHNANVYGLMPERVRQNGLDCSPASPLSWCCAEFAAALLLWSQS